MSVLSRHCEATAASKGQTTNVSFNPSTICGTRKYFPVFFCSVTYSMMQTDASRLQRQEVKSVLPLDARDKESRKDANKDENHFLEKGHGALV
ncbi:uncharacterized protein V6R79_017302 [Siganus canaliculatus]